MFIFTAAKNMYMEKDLLIELIEDGSKVLSFDIED